MGFDDLYYLLASLWLVYDAYTEWRKQNKKLSKKKKRGDHRSKKRK